MAEDPKKLLETVRMVAEEQPELARELAKTLKTATAEVEKQANLGKDIVDKFKELNGLYGNQKASLATIRKFNNDILKDDIGRDYALRAQRSAIADAEQALLEAKFAQFDVAKLQEMAAKKLTDEERNRIANFEEAMRNEIRYRETLESKLNRLAKEKQKFEEKSRDIAAQIAIQKEKETAALVKEATLATARELAQANLNIALAKSLELEGKLALIQASIATLGTSPADNAQRIRLLQEQVSVSQQFVDSKREAMDKERELNAITRDQARAYNDKVKAGDKITELLKKEASLSAEIALNEAERKNTEKDISDSLIREATYAAEIELIKATAFQRAVEQARLDVEAAEQRLAFEQKVNRELLRGSGYMKFMEASNYSMLGPAADIAQSFKDFSKSVKTIPLEFMLFNQLLKLGIDRFKKLDEAAEEFRKQTGFSNTQMQTLRKDVEAINKEFAGMGVSIDKAYASAKALSEVFGRTSLISKEALKNVSLMAVNLGVAETDAADVLSLFQGIGGATEESAMNVLKVGAGLSEKTGVPFSKVMGDIAKASGTTSMLLGTNPSKLMKAAIAARALGTDLNTLAAQQEKLLNYSDSINHELEASAMLGRSISFQRARQLAYEGKVEESARATLDMVKQAGDFNEMSIYQRKSLAAAAGMELKDLTKMMAVEAQRDAIMKGTDQAKKDQLLKQEAELENLKKRNKLDEDDLVTQNQKALSQAKMQGLVTQLNNLMDELKTAAADVLEPIITPLVKILVPVLRGVVGIAKLLMAPFIFVKDLIVLIATKIGELEPVKFIIESISSGIASASKKMEEFGKESEWIMGTIKAIAGIGGLLLVKKMFFGGDDPKSIMEMVKAPFKSAMEMGRNLVQRVRGKPPIAEVIGPKLPDATKGVADAAKSTERVPSGTGVKDFLSNLAAGLKEMGSGRVLFGALNLIPASVGLVAMIPGYLGAKLMETINGNKLMDAFTGLAAGLIEMGTGRVLLGAFNLIATSVGLVAMIPGFVGAKLLETINANKLMDAFTGLAAGLTEMGSGKVILGSLALIGAAAGLVLMIPGLIGMAGIALLGTPFSIGLIAMSAGLSSLGGNPAAWLGIAAIAALSLSFVGFAFGAKLLADAFVTIGKAIPESIVGFVQLAAVSPLLYVAAGGIGALATALGFMATMTVPAVIASLAIYVVAKSVDRLGDSVQKAAEGVSFFAKNALSIINPIKQLATANLKDVGVGISSLGDALMAFGTGTAMAGLGSLVGNLLGGDPIAKMEKLASMSDRLKASAEAIQMIAIATSRFDAVDNFAKSVGVLADSLNKLSDSLGKIKTEELSKLNAIATAPVRTETTATTATGAPMTTSGIEAKLDKLTELLVGGAVKVYIDGKLVSSAVANTAGR